MFGIKMQVTTEKASVLLRPASKSDLPVLVDYWSSMKVHLYTMGLYAQTLENEEDWYNRTRVSDSDCVWFVQPAGHDLPVGVFGLHNIHRLHNSCSAGFIIWDPKWWGKNIATTAYLGGLLFASDYLNRLKVEATIMAENIASVKAAERIGFTSWGIEPLETFRAGRWLDAHQLIWLHPYKHQFYYPEGLPDKFVPGVEQAKVALNLARNSVEFI
jgi:RimJ/RimL family protein N-acetyltransferase